uniref:HTH myb-type domain-containing protein n=1 Tax=Leersia perrieri TaxID=77586 RepID=A0A0D9VZD6_9ORYZ
MGLDVGEIGMGLDLSLDLKMFAARSAGKMAAAAKGESGVEACIRSLEEERRKIEMFRRELPLCARLLADVIELMKEEAVKRTKDAAAAAVEAKAEDGDKTKWMSTAQLWVDSRGSDADSENERRSESTSPASRLLGGAEESSSSRAVAPSPYFRREDRVGVRPAMPLLPPAAHRSPAPAVAVAAGDDHRHVVATSFASAVTSPVPALSLQTQTQTQAQQQQARKSRRCWSPELHRQFVAALQQLGGPQVATPKQIREVMKVDGLTNDEVKSHLQKYRLHNRKSPSTASANNSIVIVGDLWASQEVSCSQSGSPQGPLQLSGSGVAVSAATAGDSCCEDDDKSEGYAHK